MSEQEINLMEEKLRIEELRKGYEVCLAQPFLFLVAHLMFIQIS